MNIRDETMLNEQMKVANYQVRLKLIKSLDEKINRLRYSYKINQTQIKEAEAKSISATDFEYLQKCHTEITQKVANLHGKRESCQIFRSEINNGLGPVSPKEYLKSEQGQTLENFIASQFSELSTQIETLEAEQKQILVALKTSHDSVKFLTQLSTLQNREREIAEEGKRLKDEKETLQMGIEDLKLSNFHDNKIYDTDTPIVAAKEEISCKVGSKCLRLAEFFFSLKTCEEVFYPNVGDWREDYITALRKGRLLDAAFVAVKIYLNLVYTMVLCSKAGKLIEFIMKLADIIEFFNKFSK